MNGSHVKNLRTKRGLSLRALAAEAGVSVNTLVRLERGMPTTRDSKGRIAEALGVTLDRILLGDCVSPAAVAVHRDDSTHWTAIGDRRRGLARRLATDFVDDPDERRRLGRLGLVAGFQGVLRCGLEDGRLVNALIELYSRSPGTSRHPGEEFVRCIRGRLAIHVGTERVELGPGDCATFQAGLPHTYEPTVAGPEDLPTIFLSVCSDQP